MKQFMDTIFIGRVFGLSLLLAAGTALAAPHTQREHGAHAHGVAALTLALSDHDLAVEFGSPAVNLIGFEHAATTDKDRRAVAQAAQKLRSPLTFLSLPSAAQCSVTKTTVESELLGNATDSKDEHEHADFTAKYRWLCKVPRALDTISVQLFDAFAGIEKINAQWVSANGQNAKVLTPADPTIRLR